MPNYRRALIPGATWYFTVTLLDRSSRLLVEEIDLLRAATRRVRARYPFRIEAAVVLPDHLHAIWTLPPADADFPQRWRYIRTLFTRGLPKGELVSAVRARRGERGIWQRRYWERVIRSEADFRVHVDYIHFNPVKHGLADRVWDWPHSSFHTFVRTGVLPMDWYGKTRGLNLEDTRLTDPRKLDLLMGLIALAIAWAARAARDLLGTKWPKRKSHGYLAKSWFRTGFDQIRNLLRSDPIEAVAPWTRIATKHIKISRVV